MATTTGIISATLLVLSALTDGISADTQPLRFKRNIRVCSAREVAVVETVACSLHRQASRSRRSTKELLAMGPDADQPITRTSEDTDTKYESAIAMGKHPIEFYLAGGRELIAGREGSVVLQPDEGGRVIKNLRSGHLGDISSKQRSPEGDLELFTTSTFSEDQSSSSLIQWDSLFSFDVDSNVHSHKTKRNVECGKIFSTYSELRRHCCHHSCPIECFFGLCD